MKEFTALMVVMGIPAILVLLVRFLNWRER